MSRKDARTRKPFVRRRWVSLTMGICFAGVVAVSVHWFSAIDSAKAQPPRNTNRTATNVQDKPASSPTRNIMAAIHEQADSSIPSVVALVNGERILRDELGQACLWRFGEDVLQSLLNKQVILQECQKQNIVITAEDVQAEIVRIAAKFGMSMDRWLTMLKQERGIEPSQYRRDIIWPTLALQQLAVSQISVTPQELREAFESEFGAKVKVRMIAVSSQRKAELVLEKINAAPKDFARLAKEYSEDASASVLGVVPPIRRHMGVPQLEDAAFQLKEGEISPVVAIDDRFVILKCERHIPGTYIAERLRKDAMNRLADKMRDNKMRTVAAELFEKLQREAQVVNVYNNAELRKQMPGVAATINGRPFPISQLVDECLIRNGVEVLEGEINRRLLQQALKKGRRDVTQNDIDNEISRAAIASGFAKSDGSADIPAWLKKIEQEDGAAVDLYVYDVVWPTVALKKLIPEEIVISKKDLARAFEANYGPRVEAMAIVIGNQRTAQRVWEMARSNPTDLFFGELARQYSIDSISRSNSGQIPPVRKHGGRPSLEKEAFALRPGELSSIIASGKEFVILRCLGRTKPVVTEMDKTVEAELVRILQEKKMRRAMASQFEQLLVKARIENYLAGSVQVSSQETPAAVVPLAQR